MHRRSLLAAFAAAPFVPPRIQRLRPGPRAALAPPSEVWLRTLPDLMGTAGVPGVAAALTVGSEMPWRAAVGRLASGSDAPVTDTTIFEAASLTKPVVAYTALLLAQEGRLDLDRPLDALLGAAYTPGDTRAAAITARHVLSHATGYPNWRFNQNQALETRFAPGSRFGYSGEGFYQLQRVLEEITGTGLAELVRDRVFTPLGLRDSSLVWREEFADRMARPHRRGGEPAEPRAMELNRRLFAHGVAVGTPFERWRHAEVAAAFTALADTPPALPVFFSPNAAGSLLTTASEYARFAMVAAGGRPGPLDERHRRAAFMVTTPIQGSLAWGLGWGLETEHGFPRWAWHWGDNPGYKNFVLVDLRDGAALVVLTNGDNGRAVYERLTRAAGHDAAAFLWI